MNLTVRLNVRNHTIAIDADVEPGENGILSCDPTVACPPTATTWDITGARVVYFARGRNRERVIDHERIDEKIAEDGLESFLRDAIDERLAELENEARADAAEARADSRSEL